MKIRFKKKTVIVILLASAPLLYLASSYFQPWTLFTDTRVQEGLPQLSDSNMSAEDKAPKQTDASGSPTESTSKPIETSKKTLENSNSPVLLAQGSFIAQEHATTGLVKILEFVDGTRILRIENLDTSNGPKLEVWLTDAPVIEGVEGWRVFDDGKYINLGALKGNIGSQNYEIPSTVNLDDFSSVSIWCERFSVSFGAATLRT